MKNRLLTLLAAALAVACTNSGRCIIDGNITSYEGDKVTLLDGDGNAIAEADVADGKFRIETEAALAETVLAGDGGQSLTKLYTEPGRVKVAGDVQQDNISATGTPANDGNAAFMARLADLEERFQAAASDGEREEIYGEFERMNEQAIDENSCNIFGATLLIQTKSYSMSGHDMVLLIEAMPEPLRRTPVVSKALETARKKIATEPQSEGSDFVPHYIDLTFPNVDGAEISLKSVVENPANRFVLLDFWASWCGPCMREMPTLLHAYEQYHRYGFEIYGVSFDGDGDNWRNAVADKAMPWINVSPLSGFNNIAAEEYAVEAIPTNFLIRCPDGVIVAKNLRGSQVDTKLAEVLGD